MTLLFGVTLPVMVIKIKVSIAEFWCISIKPFGNLGAIPQNPLGGIAAQIRGKSDESHHDENLKAKFLQPIILLGKRRYK